MTSGLVSLVMPAFRTRPDWLQQAVETALAQRDCEIELVIVDDASPEPVSDLLSGIDDPRLRIIRVEHGGAARARNVGTAESRGDYLRFIDADDAIDLDSTARLLELAEGRDDLIAYGATLFCDEDLNPLWTMTSNVQGDAVEACLLGRFTTRPHAFLFPRRVVDATGEWSSDLPVSHDWDFILRALEHAQVRGTKSVVTLYRRHGAGISANVPAGGERGAQQVVERYFERHPERRGTSLERRANARAVAQAARIYASNGELGKAFRRLGGAVRLDPRAVWVEFVQALPALPSVIRRRLRRLLRRPAPGAAAG